MVIKIYHFQITNTQSAIYMLEKKSKKNLNFNFLWIADYMLVIV